jgi:hypothetical protein
MKVMISRDDRGRALIKAVNDLNLQDLSHASDDQIKAVTSLAWEIKGLFYALMKGKASDVLGDLNIGGGVKLSPSLVADLTASIPRDVVAGAQQQWLPNLAAEMANRPARDERKSGWSPTITESGSDGSARRDGVSGSDAQQAAPSLGPQPEKGAAGNTDAASAKADGGKDARSANELTPPMRAGVMDADPDGGTGRTDPANAQTRGTERLAADDDGGGGGPIIRRWNLPSGTPRAIDARTKDAEKATQPDKPAGKTDAAKDRPDGSTSTNAPSKANETTPAAAPEPDAASAKRDGDNKALDNKAIPTGEQPRGNANAQTDDLLFPTEDELRAMKAGPSNDQKPSGPEGAAGKAEAANAKPDNAAADAAPKADANAPAGAPAPSDSASQPPTKAAPVASIDSDVDPESWAEYGGWYRQDYAIFYRPTGHKDKFIYSWLFLTGPQAPKGDTSPTAAVFDSLTGKDAQGSCTKCHSVDDIPGSGRVVNFSPPSVESKQGRFTNFIHEPHFGILETRGCLTCHELEKGRPYLKSYEQGNPQNFVSNFGSVKKNVCQSCHSATKARQDCLLCHDYHVNGVITPIINTKIPVQ